MSRLLIAISLFLSVVSAVQERSYYEEKFFSWMSKFSVTPSEGQFVHFLENYISNDQLIEKHNSMGNSTYTLGHTKFSHLSGAEWKEYVRRGVKPDDSTSSLVHTVPSDFVATAIDWTTKGAVQVIKDQGQCGSCWAFSAIAGIESASFIKYGKLNSLSEQNVVDCDTRDGACNGGIMVSADNWVKSNGGVCSESSYGYTSGTTGKAGKCVTSCSIVANSAPKSATTVTANSDTAVQSALAQQPVVVAVEADQLSWQLYTGGVISSNCGTSTDHGVMIVGYGTDASSGLSYYKVKNSWGTSWGEDGYIRIQANVKSPAAGMCGILSSPSYPNM